MNVGHGRFVIKQGDIVSEEVDAVVNAANSSLMGGGGVDGAIHRAGGPQILEECKVIRERQGRCAPGAAVITTGGRLKARYVVHTVGPIWRGGGEGEESILRDAYLNSLKLAAENGARSIAFPAISTGAYRFPRELAARIALSTCIEYAKAESQFREIVFVLFSHEDRMLYEKEIRHLLNG